jgi:hypothetical protein
MRVELTYGLLASTTAWDAGDALSRHHETKHVHHERSAADAPVGSTVKLYSGVGCDPKNLLKSVDTSELTVGKHENMCDTHEPVKSMQFFGDAGAFLDVYTECDARPDSYSASIYPADGCTAIYGWPGVKAFKYVTAEVAVSKDDLSLLEVRAEKPAAKYNVVFSCESSNYFGYQVLANKYGFDHTPQTGGVWTRLMTSRASDDFSATLPTFNARRHPYAWRYGPLNKADVIEKWYASAVPPQEEVLVVIDPDNWITGDLRPLVDKVKPGHALAERAFFGGSQALVKEMWQEFCKLPPRWGVGGWVGGRAGRLTGVHECVLASC